MIVVEIINHDVSYLFIDHGFDITYKSSDDSTLQIVKYGEYLYDHIIVFAPTTKGNLTFLSVMDLFEMLCVKNSVDVWMQKF